MYFRLNVIHACVRVWVYALLFVLYSLGLMVFVVIQRHHKVPTLLLSCSDSFNFSFVITQKQKTCK